MNRLVQFFLENSKLTTIITIIFMVGGFLGLSALNSESYPQVNMATAIITTNYSGATPRNIETKITRPIEKEIRTVSGLKDVRSISQAGLSKIIVRIDMDNENVKEVMDNLKKAIDKVSDLPVDLREDPKFLEIKSEEFPAVELAIIGPNNDRKRDLFADRLKEELEDSKKVLSVRPVGFRKREFMIELNPHLMNQKHIGINEVLSQIKSRNVDISGGDIKGDFKKLVKIDGTIKNAKDLEQIVIRSNFEGKHVLLGDIAQVQDTQTDDIVLTRVNGQEATLLVVTKKGGADTIKLVKELAPTLTRFSKEAKTNGLEVSIYNNEAQKVQEKLKVLSYNATTGFILVVVFLLLFLPGKIGIMASLSLPLTVMATFALMPACGMNLNTITILALVIALGMLVDNSVVISENYSRLIGEGEDPQTAVTNSVKQLWLPISATAFTTIAAFLPMLVTKGVMGEFIQFIPKIITISLLLSLVESFFLLPLRLKMINPNQSKLQKEDWFFKFSKIFETISAFLIKYRYFTAIIFSLLLIQSIVLMKVFNRFVLFPAEQVEMYLVRMELPKGTLLTVNHEKTKYLSQKIKNTLKNDLKFVVSRSGVMETMPGDPKGKQGDNVGMATIYVTKESANIRDHNQVLEELRKIKIPGAKLTFEALQNGPPVGNPIQGTFRSNNEENIDEIASKIIGKLKNVPGILDLRLDDVYGEDEIFVDINYDRAAQIGLDANLIGQTIRTALEGNVISKVTLNNKEIDLRVRFNPKSKKSIKSLELIKIPDRSGNLIPITEVATFHPGDGSAQIKRFDFKRAKMLLGDINRDIITSEQANKLLKNEYDSLTGDYPEVSLVFGGENESTNESLESLRFALVLALMGIFALLVFLFKSYIKPAIIMSTIPLGLVGFSIAFFFHHKVISFMALIGLIGLSGIIVNSSIVLISFIEQMQEETDLDLHQILVKASGMRLRAVMVTSLTTISGLIPTAYGIGGSDKLLIPLTLAMAWGLTSGTILTLLWVPCAYAIIEDLNNFINRIFKKDNNKINKITKNSQRISDGSLSSN